jgi:hypothetical protein
VRRGQVALKDETRRLLVQDLVEIGATLEVELLAVDAVKVWTDLCDSGGREGEKREAKPKSSLSYWGETP